MAKWQNLFPQRVLDRGEIYYQNDMVKDGHLANDGEHFAVIVQGGVGRLYAVSGRLRPDGRASELSCDCPWAQKGHRCKHEVAALLTAEKLQNQPDYFLTTNDQAISFKDLVSDKIEQAVFQANPAVDPFEIIGHRNFTQENYTHALELEKEWNQTEFQYFNNKLRTYEYFWSFIDSNKNKLIITVNFTRWQITSISMPSQQPLNDQKAVIIFALLKFISEYIKDDPFDITNQAANNLLDLYSNNLTQDNEPIILRTYIDNYGALPRLSFKLGKGKHLYKIRDLSQIVEHVKNSQPIKLGKFFNEAINLQKMDRDSQKWLDLIIKFLDIRNLDSYYGYKDTIESIDIENSLADEVNDLLYEGVKLYSGIRLVGYTKDQLSLNLKILPNHGAASVIVEDLPVKTMIVGNHGYYGYYKSVWIKYNGVTPQALYNLGLHPGDELRFSKKTILKFARQILPKLEQEKYIQITGTKDLLANLPPETHFLFKLDYRNSNVLLNAKVQYGDAEYELNRYYTETEKREAEQEEKVQQKVKRYFSNFKDGQYILPNDDIDALDAFLDNGINDLKQLGEVQITNNFKTLLKGIQTKMEVGISINLTDQLLDVDLNGPKYKWEDIQAALKAYQEKRHYFVLHNGLLQKTDQPTIEQLAQELHDLGINFKDFIHGKLHLPAYRAFYFAKKMKESNALHFSSNVAFKTLINDLSKNWLKKNTLPSSLKNILRPYQKDGFNWLSTIINYNFGGLLADEMGLGKTLQIIALLLARKEQNHDEKVTNLVVAPASVIYNWYSEIQKFAPKLRVAVLGGNKQERTNLLCKTKSYDVLITSYQSLNHDLEGYQNLLFDLEIIDEAQNIKNHQSITAQSVKVIQAKHKLALTGTPIENKLSELWSIFDYLMPGFLGSYLDFRKKYEIPIVKEKKEEIQQQLSDQIAPFILRRLKKDVLADLPEKDEEVVRVKMTGKQAELYNLQTQKIIAQLNGQGDADFKKSRFQVLAQITKIREICCDPHLLYENYHGQSAKLISTINLIKDSLENGHKILLFSQFTSMLEILHEKLNKLHIPLYMITGATPKEKRQEQIQSFNISDKAAVFLISLKAGGTGINLTSADVVIHYDPWWNLAAENQATDRAHRIGQKHSVKIYKMVAQDTIEEKIIALQQKKAELANAILSNENIASAAINRKDLLRILQ